MDHDTYSANDAIGKVNISLNPLLLPSLDTTGQVIRSGKGEKSLIESEMQSTTNVNRDMVFVFVLRCRHVWLDAGF